ncbi:hypothetical protein G6F43_013699 [Rhizopus delemar]|nr:hypothetical protein G6F43_013699 [Rhizopus delemar]
MPMNTNKKRDRKSYQTKPIISSAVPDQINELQDSDDDSNDSDYKDEAMEKAEGKDTMQEDSGPGICFT